jgi:hypothetical protein
VVRALAPAAADDAHHAVLVTPTTCVSTDSALCDPQIYRANQPALGPLPAIDEVVDPILRLKLELAGYTLSDARTLRLTTVDRTDISENSDARGQTTPTWQGAKVGEGPTVATLSPRDQASAARSLGLTGIMRSTLTIIHPSNFENPHFELVLEMFALPDGTPLWTVKCNEPFETWSDTSRLLANCVGDGVLAWRAPDAVIARHL